MTREEIIERLREYELGHADPRAAYSEFWGEVIKALSQEPCDDTVSIRKDVLKCRVGNIVAYNVEWLKKHWQMEMDIVCGVKPCDDVISKEDMTIEDAIDITKKIDKFWITDKEATALDIVISKAEELSCIYDLKNRYCPRLDEHGFFKHTSVTPKPTECEDAISREAVINAIENDCMKGGLGSCFASYDDAQKFRGEIEKLPSVTQKSGKWIELPKALNPNENPCKCSECGHVLSFMNCYPKSNYCPNCGAKMESEVNNG